MTSRKRKSLSSILKAQTSPSRMALIDLNPNLNGPTEDITVTTCFDVTEQKKKKRRSLRRVSFADTYQVKEFVKDSERNDSVDSTTHSDQNQQSRTSSEGRPGSSSGSNTGSHSSHQITGLETLLSGTITQEAKSMTSMQASLQASDQMAFRQTNRSTVAVEIQGDTVERDEIKSNFLKSFMAADSAREERGEQQPGGSWMDQVSAKPSGGVVTETRDQEDSSFRSNFLQAFMASSSSSKHTPENQVGDKTQLFGQEDAGMELTACLTSAQPSSGKAEKEETMGEITRIFSGQESMVNGNGMELTTCMGGYNTQHFHRELKQPAAESTRIFCQEDNMDITLCTKSFGNADSHSQKTMNTTTLGGTMDFTAMYGKLSDSAVARLPDESTGRLLAQVDELIGGAKTEEASSGQSSNHASRQESSNYKKDITRRSTVLDTIHEVSSTNGSMFNSTVGGRSVSLMEKDVTSSNVDCPEEDMDITTGNNVPVDVQGRLTAADHTRHFKEDDTAGMEMTCAVGGLLTTGSQLNLAVSTSQVTDLRGNQTKVFPGDEAADMEMTCAGKGFISIKGDVSSTLDLKQDTGEDNTTRFHCISTGTSELTCLGDLPEGLAYQVKRKREMKVSDPQINSSGDKTCFFGATDAGDMDMTECLDRVPSKHEEEVLPGIHAAGGPHIASSSKFSFGEETKLFRSEAAADMDLTQCNTKPHTSHSVLAQEPQGSQVEGPLDDDGKTQVFSSTDAPDMEMTTCLGSLPSVQPSVESKHISFQQQNVCRATDDSEKTQVFSTEDAPDMEMTTCLGSLPPALQSQGNQYRQPQQQIVEKSPDTYEKSKVFSADEAPDMEMTACLGSLPSVEPIQENQHRPFQQRDDCRAADHSDKTQVFSTEDAPDMEMTTCLGSLPSALPSCQGKGDQKDDIARVVSLNSSHQSRPPPTQQSDRVMHYEDRTTIFHSDGGGDMEMTTCIGSLPAPQQSSQENLQTQSDDRTRVFQNEGCANMEMTTCLGAIPSIEASTKLDGQNSEHLLKGRQHKIADAAGIVNVRQRDNDGTKFFQADLGGADMEFTTCLQETASNLPHDSAGVDTRAERNTKQFSTESTLRMDVSQSASCNTSRVIQFKDQEKSQVKLESHSGDQSSATATNQQCGQDISSNLNVSEETHEKTSDTYTLSSPTVAHDARDLDSESSPSIPAEGRRSDTFTITAETTPGDAESPSAKGASADDKMSTMHEVKNEEGAKSVEEDLGSSRGSTSSDGTSGSGEAHITGISFNLKDSIVLPDWICAEDEKGILDELPINNDNTEDLCITAAKRPRLDESVMSMSHANASLLTSDISQLPSLPRDRPVSLSDFLQMFCDSINDLPVGKPSIMCSLKATEPQTLGELLEESCVIRPKADMFNWAVDFLSPTIDSLREGVKTQEERYSNENPAVITELQNADSEKYALIVKKVEALHKYCTSSTKSKMKQWRLKMITNTKSAMENSLKHLETKVSKLTDSITNLENQLDQIKSVESSLDEAIASLENCQLPTEEEKREWMENAKKLESMTAELKGKQEAVSQAERERGELEVSKQGLREETTRLEEEREELRRWERETGAGDREASLEELKSQLSLSHGFQEWRLQAFNETSYRFSFLQKSIILSVQYEDSNSSGKLINITLDSKLADDASASAKLAHSMFFTSVSLDKLRMMFSTRAALPQLLQHLSELVGQSRTLETEVRRIDFWHPITATNNRLSIKYFSVEAHSMFHIHLDLLPGQYPFTAVPHSSTVKIGRISEECIKKELDQVKPGWKYVTRLSNAVSNLLKIHSL